MSNTQIVSSKKFKKISTALESRYGKYAHQEFDEFKECMMYQILALGTTPEAAHQALSNIHEEFVDWNDMRMATVREIQDILGADYARCREKSEDVINLLADLYTAFRRMNITEIIPTDDGIMTMRALPKTTLLRRDMVEIALHEVYNIPSFGCDPDQFALLQFLGGINKKLTYDEGMTEIIQALIEEQISIEELRDLSYGLQSHCDFLAQAEIYDPKAIGYGWNKPDPLSMKVAKFKPQNKKLAAIDPITPKPKPIPPEEAAAAAAASAKAEDAEADLKKLSDAMPESEVQDSKPQIVVVAEGEEDAADSTDKIDAAMDKAEATDVEASTTKETKEESTATAEVAPKTTAQKKTASSSTTSSSSKKAAVKKTAVKKENSSSKKAAVKKTTTKKEASSSKKKAVAKKPAAKKSSAKKTVAKKAPAKKTAVKKSAAKKTAAKKAPAKATKKAAPKKAAAKKAPKKK